jgi:hypothetical protein
LTGKPEDLARLVKPLGVEVIAPVPGERVSW